MRLWLCARLHPRRSASGKEAKRCTSSAPGSANRGRRRAIPAAYDMPTLSARGERKLHHAAAAVRTVTHCMPRYLFGTGCFKTISIIAHTCSSSTAQNYRTMLSRLSGAGAHGECATFEVWVEAFGAEQLLFLLCLLR